MVLAAKDDRMPDCVSKPEQKAEEKEQDVETVEVEVTVQNTVSDEELSQGETGTILAPEEFGEPVQEPTKKTVRRKKDDKTPSKITWFQRGVAKVKNLGYTLYDKMNEE